ncbi:hypothetical protein TeGR_g8821, partial [Tetraparma gracilis]
IQPRAPLTHAPSTPLLPTFLGIGPAKSGTTALIELLRPLRGVRIGELYTRSYAEEKRANGKFWPELAFFLDTDSFHSTDGIAYYESLFKVETRQPYEGEQIVAVGEKTPAYSGFPLTPYQVKDKLGGDVNLLFTVRDPVEAVVSKYIYHQCCVRDDQTEELECGGDTGCRESFVRYHEMLFLEHTNKAECARRRGLKLGMNDEIYSEVGGDSKAAYLNDARLLAHCQVPSSADLAQQLTDHAMATNLRRWQHVFGADNIMCLHNTDLARNPQHARRVAANFIGAPEPELDRVQEPEKMEARGSVLDRLKGKKGAIGTTETEVEAEFMLYRLREFYETESAKHAWRLCAKNAYSVIMDPDAAEQAGVTPAPEWEWVRYADANATARTNE